MEQTMISLNDLRIQIVEKPDSFESEKISDWDEEILFEGQPAIFFMEDWPKNTGWVCLR